MIHQPEKNVKNCYIPTTDVTVTYKLPYVIAGLPNLGADAEITFAPIDNSQLDQVGLELFRHDYAPVSVEKQRAVQINEIYALRPPELADEEANLLDEFWRAEEVYRLIVEDWRTQYKQGVADARMAGLPRPQAELPPHPMPIRRRMQATQLVEDLTKKSEKIRDLSVEISNYTARQAEGLARIAITGWTGFATPFGRNGAMVTKEAWSALCVEIGRQNRSELIAHINGYAVLSKEDEGNSGSQSSNDSDPDSSQEQSGDLESKSGESDLGTTITQTDPSTSIAAPHQTNGSETITEPWSPSTSGSTTAIATGDNIQAVAGTDHHPV